MKIFKSHYLPILVISLIINIFLVSVLCYGTFRIASSGIVSWIDFMNFDNLDIRNENMCKGYLRGRQFIGDNGRTIEFDYHGRAYIIYKGNNKTICAGWIKWKENYNSDIDRESSLDYKQFEIDNTFAGKSSFSFELNRDGTIGTFGDGTYFPVR